MSSASTTQASSASRGRRTILLAGLAVVVLLLAVIGWWLSRDDAPEAANLETAAASVTDDAAGENDDGADDPAGSNDAAGSDDGEAADGTGDAATSDGIEGDWLVDTSVGEFSFGESTGTFVGFRVGEELQGLGEIEAVGRTPGVSGTVTIEGTSAVAATIEADMAAITTDDSRRDDRVHGALDIDEFPTATFVLTSPIEFGEGAAAGDPVSTTATGDLTVHGVTQPVEFAVDAQLVEGTIVLVGSTEVSFADFGVTVPSAPIVLSANDFGTVELQLFLAKS